MTTKGGAQKDNSENDYIFDIIISFLRSPRWKTPIMSFLDEKCVVFDNEDENKLEYTALHKEFSSIVEELIGELLAELGITQEVFLNACEEAQKNTVHRKIVDQLTAVDSFQAFKKLMVKRNEELNKQVIEMMAQEKKKVESGVTQGVPVNNTPDPKAKPMTAEELKKHEQEQIKLVQSKKITDKGMQEALKVAQKQQELEEENAMKQAIEESLRQQLTQKTSEQEEMDMIQKAIELSKQEEDERNKKDHDSQLSKQQEEYQTKIEKQSQEELQKAEALRKENEDLKRALEEEKQKQIKQAELLAKSSQQTQQPQEVKKVEEIKQEVQSQEAKAVVATMSDAELRKLEELKKLKEANKLKKQQEKEKKSMGEETKQDFKTELPSVNLKRGKTGAFVPFDGGFGKQKTDLSGFQDMDTVLLEEEKKKKKLQEEQEGKSFSQLLKEKREAAERVIDSKKEEQKGQMPERESAEERKKRLLAQRDLLRQQKADKREKELQEFNQKTEGNKQNLFDELKNIDNKIKNKEANSQQQLGGVAMDEKRREMYRNLNKGIKEDDKQQKMENMYQRAEQLKQNDSKTVHVEDDEAEVIQPKKKGGFLSGLKSFNVK